MRIHGVRTVRIFGKNVMDSINTNVRNKVNFAVAIVYQLISFARSQPEIDFNVCVFAKVKNVQCVICGQERLNQF